MTTISIDHELAAAIHEGEQMNRLSTTSKVRLIEVSSGDLMSDEPNLNDEALNRKLEIIEAEKISTNVRMRNFFIPWAIHDRRLAITPASFLKLCATIHIPILFLEGLLDPDYWVRLGNGLFFSRDESGEYSSLDLFYRCPSSWGGRAYIYTKYDFARKLTTNLCFNFLADLLPLGGIRRAQSAIEEPLAIHIILASHILKGFIVEASKLRVQLIKDEEGQFANNPKENTEKLHQLAQQLHIAVENFNDFEDLMAFLIKAHERIKTAINPNSPPAKGHTNESQVLELLHSKGHASKRWLSNYRDRANIRINLAFHLSTQVDNDINLQISQSTSALARDAQRDSSSMITIAAVTMFFLPGTFISAVFSMTFFNFQQDPTTGAQQLQVSSRWWYFLAATIPLTIVVFLVWIVWTRWRFRNQKEEDEDSLEASEKKLG